MGHKLVATAMRGKPLLQPCPRIMQTYSSACFSIIAPIGSFDILRPLLEMKSADPSYPCLVFLGTGYLLSATTASKFE
jgi:hypothetical protein